MLNIYNYTAPIRQGAPVEQVQLNDVSESVENNSAAKKQGSLGVDINSLLQFSAKARQVELANTIPPTSEENIDERHLARQQLVGSVNGLAQSGVSFSSEQKQELNSSFFALYSSQPSGSVDISSKARATISDAEIWDLISNNITKIGDNYLGVYENVVAIYTEFYQKFSDVLSKMGGWLLPGKDGNTVKLDVTSLNAALETMINKYNQPGKDTILFPAQTDNNIKGVSRAEAEQWLKDLNLPDSCLKQVGSSFVVIVDLTPLNTMRSDLNTLGAAGSDGQLELDNAKYQAWQSGFKAQEENLKTTLQTLTQKYSNANSLYDNLVKILSSTISSTLETAKSFLQG